MRNLAARAAMMAKSGRLAFAKKSLFKAQSYDIGFFKTGISAITLPVTMTAWWKADLLNVPACIVKLGGSSNGALVGWYKLDGNVDRNVWYLCDGKYWIRSNLTYQLGVWSHVAVAITDGTYPYKNKVWVNGNMASSWFSPWESSSAAINNPTSEFYVGGRGFGEATDAISVCYPKIYNGVLTQNEVEADMNARGAEITSSNLIHSWSGNGASSVVPDDIGDWDLTASTGCSLSDDTPWSNT